MPESRKNPTQKISFLLITLILNIELIQIAPRFEITIKSSIYNDTSKKKKNVLKKHASVVFLVCLSGNEKSVFELEARDPY